MSKAWHLTVLLALFFITGCDSSPPDPAEEDPPASPTPEMGAPAGATSDPLPDTDTRLDILPIVLTAWAD